MRLLRRKFFQRILAIIPAMLVPKVFGKTQVPMDIDPYTGEWVPVSGKPVVWERPGFYHGHERRKVGSNKPELERRQSALDEWNRKYPHNSNLPEHGGTFVGMSRTDLKQIQREDWRWKAADDYREFENLRVSRPRRSA
jgi:hypothetical protein